MQTKTILITIAILAIAITGGFILLSGNNNTTNPGASGNISMINGKQVITIDVKGGYSPRVTAAKANVPTVIKFRTQNTFDCSSSVAIPSLNYRANLQPSGETSVDVPAQQAGTSLKGLCSMGMYNFAVDFN